jgi:hypothetical protein
MPIITLPVAAHSDLFRWQLDLFWYGHRQTYGLDAANRAHAILVNCNHPDEPRITHMPWDISLLHSICYSVYDYPPAQTLPYQALRLAVPLNIQLGLMQVLPQYPDDQMIELTDCDMVHFRPCPVTDIEYDQLAVSTIYENWHLFSQTSNRHVIEPYFENGGRYYNGGFCPIIGRAKTFRRILPEWIAVHLDILRQDYELNFHWWAGMFALQAACEKARVTMMAEDYCYVPGANTIRDSHYTGHYCVDHVFNKRTYPNIDVEKFPDDPYFNLIKRWLSLDRPPN